MIAELIHNFTPRCDVLLLLGLALFAGSITGKLFTRLRIPQVVGYILIGFLAGQSGLNLIDQNVLEDLEPFNYFALGLIGFMIGGELKASALKRYGRQLMSILLMESLLAFIFVSLLGTLACMLMFGPKLSLALGLLLGSISAATAPAATTDVLWEYKTRGPLTTIVLGIVALDDGVSLILFSIAASIANSLLGKEGATVLSSIGKPIYEVGGAIVWGCMAGYILKEMIKRTDDSGKVLTSSIGGLLVVIAVARALELDFLLASMTVGVFLTNYTPHKSIDVFKTVDKFTPPIYVVFFVFFGMKMDLSSLSMSTALLVVVYLVGRTMGKMLGAKYGAKMSGAAKQVERYLPFCLFSQAGVAIGLSILAGHYFSGAVGDTIVIVITATTFVVQIIGPPMVKFAVTKAGEVGKNLTAEDLIQTMKVSDVMYSDLPVLSETSVLQDILQAFSEGPHLWFPVTDHEKKLVGIISVEHIKSVLVYSQISDLLLAHDLMEDVSISTSPETLLVESQKIMKSHLMEFLPVLAPTGEFVGILEGRAIERAVSMKLLSMQKSSY